MQTNTVTGPVEANKRFLWDSSREKKGQETVTVVNYQTNGDNSVAALSTMHRDHVMEPEPRSRFNRAILTPFTPS